MTQLRPMTARPTPVPRLQPPRRPVLSDEFLAQARANTFGDVRYDGEPDPAEDVLARVGDWMPLPAHLPSEMLVGRRL